MSKINTLLHAADKALDTSNSPFSMEFYRKNFRQIVVVIILLLCYIQLRYDYEDCVSHIAALKRELNDVRYTSIDKWGALTTRNSRQAIRQAMAQKGVALEESVEPPVEVK